MYAAYWYTEWKPKLSHNYARGLLVHRIGTKASCMRLIGTHARSLLVLMHAAYWYPCTQLIGTNANADLLGKISHVW
jgi:hypothetical protein